MNGGLKPSATSDKGQTATTDMVGYHNVINCSLAGIALGLSVLQQ